MAKTIEQKREESRIRMAIRRKENKEFAESQRLAKRKWYRENSVRYKAYVIDWRHKNRHKVTAYTRKWRYGISQEEFDKLFENQGKKCAVCGNNESGKCWCVDHDHSCCGQVRACSKCIRGIICTPCNLMLGGARDNKEILAKAIKYLDIRNGLWPTKSSLSCSA